MRQKFMMNYLGAPTPADFPYILSHSTTLEDAQETPPATYFRFEGVTGTGTATYTDDVAVGDDSSRFIRLTIRLLE